MLAKVSLGEPQGRAGVGQDGAEGGGARRGHNWGLKGDFARPGCPEDRRPGAQEHCGGGEGAQRDHGRPWTRPGDPRQQMLVGTQWPAACAGFPWGWGGDLEPRDQASPPKPPPACFL